MLIAAVVLVVGIAAWLFYKKTRDQPSPTSRQPPIRLQGPGTYEFAVRGDARYQPELEKLCDVGQSDPKIVEALLVPADANERDKNAVRVEVKGRTVGYLAPEVAEVYRKRLVESGYPGARSRCKAKIIPRLHSSFGRGTHYGIHLDLPQKRSSSASTAPPR
jgi:hypothetical protein